jgi:hypothetical protein
LLPDGTYDAFVVDATPSEDDGIPAMTLDLTIVSGEHKGEMVSVRASGLGRTATDLLGMPATLTVSGGSPDIAIDG